MLNGAVFFVVSRNSGPGQHDWQYPVWAHKGTGQSMAAVSFDSMNCYTCSVSVGTTVLYSTECEQYGLNTSASYVHPDVVHPRGRTGILHPLPTCLQTNTEARHNRCRRPPAPAAPSASLDTTLRPSRSSPLRLTTLAVDGLACAKIVLAKAEALVLVWAANARLLTVAERKVAALALKRVCRRRGRHHRNEQRQQQEGKKLGRPSHAANSHGG